MVPTREKGPSSRPNLSASVCRQEPPHPEVVKDLTALLERYVAQGRSTPGKPQNNGADVDIWKHEAQPKAGKKGR